MVNFEYLLMQCNVMKVLFVLVTCLALFMSGCVKKPPSNTENICKIFKQYPSWYKDTKATQKRWGIPIWVQMAIMHQESRFNAKALPARKKLLWVIPWKRPSTAYGYTQALKSTWENYKKKQGSMFASRTDFGDAVDFIGWYSHQARKRAGISLYNAEQLYLAYHEGVGGFQRKTYLKKPWLISVAKKVERRAQMYHRQLGSCEKSLNRHWYSIF